MTIEQQSELDRAIARATAKGVTVVAQGKTHDGNRFFVVPSQSEAGGYHMVVLIDGARLSCDCAARVICTHRAATHLELAAEAARKAAAAAAIAAAEQQIAAEANAAAKADMAKSERKAERANRRRPHHEARLVNDTRAFSVFK